MMYLYYILKHSQTRSLSMKAVVKIIIMLKKTSHFNDKNNSDH